MPQRDVHVAPGPFGDLDIVAPQVFRTVVNAKSVAALGLAVPADVARVANLIQK